LNELREFKRLTTLNLNFTHITDAGLKSAQGRRELDVAFRCLPKSRMLVLKDVREL